MGVLGVPVTYSTTSAVAYAQPPQNAYNVPPPTALYLYEPVWNCTGPQCFDAGAHPAAASSPASAGTVRLSGRVLGHGP